MEKACTKCKIEKPFGEFKKEPRVKTGFASCCLTCHNKETKLWRENNKEHNKQLISKWKEFNKERYNQLKKTWNDLNKNRRKQTGKAWEQANPDKCRAKLAKRRAKKLKATPPWLTKNQLAAIESVYQEAVNLSNWHNTPYHVDHIIPLQGKDVCGLHVSWNLRPIPATENIKKGNRL